MGRGAERGRRRVKKAAPPQRGPVAVVAGFFGELLLTAGVVVLLFVVYTLWGTGLQTAAAQDDLGDELGFSAEGEPPRDATPPAETKIGDAYGVIRIPRFGDDWKWYLVQGVDDEDLKNGPGHYLDSANPGEKGNFAVAAHRSGHGEPFAKFPELRVGDRIEVITADGRFVYELDNAPDGDSDGNKIEIKDSWVVNPVPKEGESKDAEPTERRITLTTCWPRFGSSHRMYATGVLVEGGENTGNNNSNNGGGDG